MKEKCYPDIPDPYKSSVLSLIKSKVNGGKLYVCHISIKDQFTVGTVVILFYTSSGRYNKATATLAPVAMKWVNGTFEISSIGNILWFATPPPVNLWLG